MIASDNPNLQDLHDRLSEVNDLEMAAMLLHWDQATYMPAGGAAARGRQISTLARLAHRKSTDPAIGRLLEQLESHESALPYDSNEASLIRVARRDYQRSIRVPEALMAEITSHAAQSFQVWAEARPSNDFARIEPYLAKTLDLSRRLADCYPGYEHIADPLINFYAPARPWADFGMKVSTIRPLFTALREQLVPIVKTIAAQPLIDDTFLHQLFPFQQQLDFGLKVVERLGYDLRRGRLDLTHHPFMTRFSIDDVRITTRVDEHNLSKSLFSTIHEAGHAMYEQGVSPELEATPLARGASAALHESQSRMWENLVGRSRRFWNFMYPQLQAAFPNQLDTVPLDAFYRAINRVQPSLIRTGADEVTYNLHVMLRFELELDLLEGSLAIRDLPEAWRARYISDLGISPPDDRDGVLQDVHWYDGIIGGAFQEYTLGNLLSAQFFEAACTAQPHLLSAMDEGRFETLHRWLIENVHQHGRKYLPEELIRRVSGRPLGVEAYVRYLRQKYGELYQL